MGKNYNPGDAFREYRQLIWYVGRQADPTGKQQKAKEAKKVGDTSDSTNR